MPTVIMQERGAPLYEWIGIMLSDAQRQRMADRQARREMYLRMRSAEHEPETAGFTPVQRGHRALHPLLVVIPTAAFLLAVAFDVVYLVSGVSGWARGSSGLLFVGLLGSLPATAIGAADWARIPEGTQARSIAAWHGLVSAFALVLLILGWLSRVSTASAPGLGSILLVWSGAAILMLGGILGGELSTRLGRQPAAPAVETGAAPTAAVTVIGPAEPVAEDRQIARA